jgi:hypothetical protein
MMDMSYECKYNYLSYCFTPDAALYRSSRPDEVGLGSRDLYGNQPPRNLQCLLVASPNLPLECYTSDNSLYIQNPEQARRDLALDTVIQYISLDIDFW